MSKSAVVPINSTKNKLNNEIILIFNSKSNALGNFLKTSLGNLGLQSRTDTPNK